MSFMTTVIYLLWFTSSYIQSHLLDLPPDVLSNILSNYLDFNDRINSISTVNRHCYGCLNRVPGREIHRSDIRNLSHWFSYGNSACHLNEIKSMITTLKFTEIYYFYLPKLLGNLYKDWKKRKLFYLPKLLCNLYKDWKKGTLLTNDEALTETLIAMNLHPLGIISFNNLSSINDPVKLLLLSSRSLLNYFIPSYPANGNETNLGEIEHTSDHVPYFCNFPWLSPDDGSSLDIYRLTEWPLYMSYLYEFYFSLSISMTANLESIFHLDGAAKKKLMILINNYGFIPWSKSTIQSTRNKFKISNIYKVYSEFNSRVYDKLLLNTSRIPFKSYLLVNLKQNHCNIPLNQIPDPNDAFKREVLFLCWCNWQYKSKNWWNKYVDLVDILAELLGHEDEFMTEILLDLYDDNHFREDTIYHLWKSNVTLFADADGKIKRLLKSALVQSLLKYVGETTNFTY